LLSAISDLERVRDERTSGVLQALSILLRLPANSHPTSISRLSALNEQTHQIQAPAVPPIVPAAYHTPGASMRFTPDVDQWYYQTSSLSQRAESSASGPATLYSAATMQSNFTYDGTMFYNPHQLHESAEPSITEENFQWPY